ncbi:type II CRISPR RNA-guided endonuclease Cas9 [Acidithiobacillus sp. IBUN Pt1247-S3]|uniref:type II CRISPR RNA-guided endonuclease Cas9 n=1 Tax=Acidithiobacillus sp. IBUN Pt1247-S3 TaxID=3166642 RepID=UPI0034E3DBCF
MELPQQCYTLGLDIGMASVGAALLADGHIHALHVRAFNAAETAKEGESLNNIRREARLTRRRIRRRAHRLLRLRRLFKREGLIASHAAEALSTPVSPWDLRAQGINQRLAPQEWAAALYHIVKHRGFQSNRKSEAKADEKAGQMLSGVTANQNRMSEDNWRTVGEMAARDETFAHAKRNKGGDYSHTFARADLEHELKTLFAAQRTLANPHTSPALEQAVHTLLMARRPTLSGENLLKMVGKCTFETTEYRAPKASHTAERFVWLTRLNNLRINDQGETRGLHDEERQAIIHLPFVQAKISYKQLRSKIGLSDTARFIGVDYWKKRKEGNELAAEDAALFEAKAFHLLRKAYEEAGLKTEWTRDAANPDRLDALAYAQTVFKDDAEARDWMQQQGIEPTIIEAVLTVSFSDFIRLSIKALHNILPYMQAGQRYDQAVQSAGYAHHSQLHTEDNKKPRLPPISKEDYPNPVVYRALNQARKLVNAIIDEYGAPNEVHIELARDLSKPWDERKKIEREQKGFAERKETLVTKFRERFDSNPRRDQLLKMRLYDEQQAHCAYSQKPLDLGRLLEDGYAEIDHALPYSRSFDDGMSNKVLVLTVENRNKGNRTPYEYLDGEQNSERWRSFQAFVQGNKSYRQAKRERLLRKDFSDKAAEGFRERNLNDTRYIARAFKTLVEQHLQLAEDSESKRCTVVSGQLTAFLRTRWGLNKVRENGDLHHALDAAVVAAANHRMVKRLADYARRKELNQAREGFIDPQSGEVLDIAALRQLEAAFPAPWPHFRDELQAWLSPDPALHLEHVSNYDKARAQTINPIRVSRAPLRRGLGQAHQETIRSAKLLDQGMSAVKTPLENLKLKDIERIVGWDDPRNEKLIEAIRQRLIAHGDDGKKAFKEPFYKPSKPGKAAPLVRTVNLTDTQKSGIPIRGGIANNGAMLRVDIFTDGKKFHAVPLYVADVVKPALPNRAVMAYKPEDEWTVMDENYRFLFSLHPNDWVKISFKKDSAKEGYFSGLNRATGAISIWTHDRSNLNGKGGFLDGIGIKTALSVEKYHVDLLGRLYPVKEETRQPLNHKRKG